MKLLDLESLQSFSLVDSFCYRASVDYGKFHLRLSERKMIQESFDEITAQRKFRTVDVTGPINITAVSELIKNNHSWLENLWLRQLDFVGPEFADLLKLEKLKGLSLEGLSFDGLPAETLELPNLQDLVIQSEGIPQLNFANSFLACHLITRLHIDIPSLESFLPLIAQLHHLKILQVRGSANSLDLQQTPSKLEKLVTMGVAWLHLLHFLGNQDEIEVLNIADADFQDIPIQRSREARTVARRLFNLKSLKSLSFDINFGPIFQTFFGVSNHHIRFLKISRCQLKSVDVGVLTFAFAQLDHLELYDCVRIEDPHFERFIKLTQLTIHFGDNVNLADAISYAVQIKQHSPQVSLKISVRGQEIDGVFYEF